MAQTTTNYELIKPEKSDNYSVDVMGTNMDVIDSTMKAQDTRIATIESEVNGDLVCNSVTASIVNGTELYGALNGGINVIGTSTNTGLVIATISSDSAEVSNKTSLTLTPTITYKFPSLISNIDFSAVNDVTRTFKFTTMVSGTHTITCDVIIDGSTIYSETVSVTSSSSPSFSVSYPPYKTLELKFTNLTYRVSCEIGAIKSSVYLS